MLPLDRTLLLAGVVLMTPFFTHCGQDPAFVVQRDAVSVARAGAGATTGSADGLPGNVGGVGEGVADDGGQGDGGEIGGVDDDLDSNPGNSSGFRPGSQAQVDSGSETGSNPGGNPGSEPSGQPDVFERTFQASRLVLTEMDLNNADALSTQDLLMVRERLQETRAFQQIVREQITDRYTQGNLPSRASESFNQNQSGVLDIAIVIDNSGSMNQEQKNLASKLEPLLRSVSHADWRVGVVTTDPNNACMRAMISKGDADADTAFRTAIEAGIGGSGNEQGIRQAVTALSCATPSWVRSQSSLAVLVVSDEDNCSNGSGCKGTAWADESYLVNYLASIREVGVSARAYGIFSHPDAPCATAAYKGSTYARMVERTGGQWGDICDADYSATLNSISRDMQTILKDQFALKHTPLANTLVVRVNGAVWASGYKLSGNVLTFTELPPQGAQIDVQYDYGGTGMVDEVTLSKDPVPNSVKVTINGVALSAGEFALKGADKRQLEFAHRPTERAKIVVSYARNQQLLREFVVQSGLATRPLVKVNGNEISDYSYDSASGKVVLGQIPAEGAEIVISYFRAGSPILAYPLAIKIPDGSQLFDLGGVRLQTGAAVAVSYADGKLKFAAEDFVEGDAIRVSYLNPSGREQRATLPGDAVLASVQAGFVGSSRCHDENVVLNGYDLSFDCLLEGHASLHVTYQVVKDEKLNFTVDGMTDASGYNWKVTVNDQVVTSYVVDGATVKFLKKLPPEAVVRIVATRQ